MRKFECYCDFCGTRIAEPINMGDDTTDYGLIPLDCSGKLYYGFDACRLCLETVVDLIRNYKLETKK